MQSKILLLLLIPQLALADLPAFCPPAGEGATAERVQRQMDRMKQALNQRRPVHNHFATPHPVTGAEHMSVAIRAQNQFLEEGIQKRMVERFCQSETTISADITRLAGARPLTTPGNTQACEGQSQLQRLVDPTKDALRQQVQKANEDFSELAQAFDRGRQLNEQKIQAYGQQVGAPGAAVGQDDVQRVRGLVEELPKIWGARQNNEWSADGYFSNLMKQFRAAITTAEGRVAEVERLGGVVTENIRNCGSRTTTDGAVPPGRGAPGGSPTPGDPAGRSVVPNPGNDGARNPPPSPGSGSPGSGSPGSSSSLFSTENILIGAGLLGVGALGYYAYDQSRGTDVKVFGSGSSSATSTNSGTSTNTSTGTSTGDKLQLGAVPSGAVVGSPIAPVEVRIVRADGSATSINGVRVTVTCEGLHPCPFASSVVETQGGKATFSNITFTSPAAAIKLVFMAPGMASVVSGMMSVQGAGPTVPTNTSTSTRQ